MRHTRSHKNREPLQPELKDGNCRQRAAKKPHPEKTRDNQDSSQHSNSDEMVNTQHTHPLLHEVPQITARMHLYADPFPCAEQAERINILGPVTPDQIDKYDSKYKSRQEEKQEETPVCQLLRLSEFSHKKTPSSYCMRGFLRSLLFFYAFVHVCFSRSIRFCLTGI
ncbi:hypothetical protein DXA96_18560 [Lachnospiraceae bacterium OF09-33XD]|nr:hypothetical protein DXA96_18560 [Lachnospiraceae bacterium OF09-33XD]